MAEIMEADVRQTGRTQQTGEPATQGRGVHGATQGICEDEALVPPCRSKLKPLLDLLGAMFAKHINDGLRKRYRTASLGRLRLPVDKALVRQALYRLRNRGSSGVQVHILPPQSEKLRTPKACVNRRVEEAEGR
jgi:hypothetical protein